MRTSLANRLAAGAVVAAALSALPASAADPALKHVMKKMQSAQTAGDLAALAPLFAQTKAKKPADPAFAAWDAIADRGKAAADKGDLAGAKATCRECHHEYKEKYRDHYGSKAP
jgi:cytochrome c553